MRLLRSLLYHLFLLLRCYFKKSSVYAGSVPMSTTAITPNGFVLAESDGGFANRLRVLAAYMWIAYAKFDRAHLVFIWDINEACPGHFLEIFQQMNNVAFATNSSRYVLDKHAKIVYENSWAVFTWTMMQNKIPKNRFGFPSWVEIEELMYKRFVPRPEIMETVNKFVKRHNICSIGSMHIRGTDLAQRLVSTKKKRVDMGAYFAFVESRPANQSIYLLTDDPKVQRLFLSKYGSDKILVYSTIAYQEEGDNKGTTVSSSSLNQESKDVTFIDKAGKYAVDHRFTTLEHTAVDVLIAAHSNVFKPAIFSSLSDLVAMLSKIGKRDRRWCV